MSGSWAIPHLVDGTAMVVSSQTEQPEPAPGSVFRGIRLHRRVRLVVNVIDTLVRHDGGYSEVYVGNGRSHVTYYTPRYHLAVGADGVIALADGASRDILIFGRQPGATRLIRRAGPLRPVTDAEAEAARRQRREVLARARDVQHVNATIAAIPRPELFPGISGLIIDKAGYRWAAEPAGPFDHSTTWIVYDAEGIWVESIDLPTHTRLLEVGEHHMLALVRDDVGQEYIARYSVQRGST